LRKRDILLTLNPAADGDDDLSLGQVNGLLHFLERSFRTHADLANVDLLFLQRRSTSLRRLIRAISP
jgi:hypothetical protein